MKQGWIQVDSNGGKEELAPKTMADLVYVDEAREKTVKDALAEGFVAVFEHSMSEAGGNRVHNFVGSSGFVGMGRALITEEIRTHDQVMVNGEIYAAYQGGENIYSLPQGTWQVFVVDGTSINFNMGGAGMNINVIAVASKDTLPIVARKNTIAIITTRTITGWKLCSADPKVDQEGFVWIANGLRTDTALTLGKAGLNCEVYPAGASVRVKNQGTGAWGWENAMIATFDGEVWRLGGKMMLWDNGPIGAFPEIEVAVDTSLLVTFSDGYIQLRGNGSNTGGGIITTDPIDMTNVRSITMRYTRTHSADDNAYAGFGGANLMVTRLKANGAHKDKAEALITTDLKASSSQLDIKLDTSKITGLCYIAVRVYVQSSSKWHRIHQLSVDY